MNTNPCINLRQITDSHGRDAPKGQKTPGVGKEGVFHNMMIRAAADKTRQATANNAGAYEPMRNARSDRDRSKSSNCSEYSRERSNEPANDNLSRQCHTGFGIVQNAICLSGGSAEPPGVNLPVMIQPGDSEMTEPGNTATAELIGGLIGTIGDLSQILYNHETVITDTATANVLCTDSGSTTGVLNNSPDVNAGAKELIGMAVNGRTGTSPADAGLTASEQPAVSEQRQNGVGTVVVNESADIRAVDNGRAGSAGADSAQTSVVNPKPDTAETAGQRLSANMTGQSAERSSGTANHPASSELSSAATGESKHFDSGLRTPNSEDKTRLTAEEVKVRDAEPTEQSKTSLTDIQVRHSDGPGETANARPQELKAAPFVQIADLIASKQCEGVKVFSLMLEPAELGKIDINLKQIHGKMIISIAAECAKTQELLAHQAPRLISMLGMNSLHVESVQIFGQEAQFGQEGAGYQSMMNPAQRETGEGAGSAGRSREHKGKADVDIDVSLKETVSYYEGLMDLKA